MPVSCSAALDEQRTREGGEQPLVSGACSSCSPGALVAPGGTSHPLQHFVTIATRLHKTSSADRPTCCHPPLFSPTESVKERTPVHNLLVATHSVVPINSTFFCVGLIGQYIVAASGSFGYSRGTLGVHTCNLSCQTHFLLRGNVPAFLLPESYYSV